MRRITPFSAIVHNKLGFYLPFFVALLLVFGFLGSKTPFFLFATIFFITITIFSIMSAVIYFNFKIAFVSPVELVLKNIITNKISLKVCWSEIKTIKYSNFIFSHFVRFKYLNENGVSKSGRFQIDKYSKKYLKEILNQNNLELK